MSQKYIYRTLIIPLSFGASELLSMLNEVDDLGLDFTNMIYSNFKSYMTEDPSKYNLSDDEISNMELFDLSQDSQARYKVSIITKRYLKSLILEVLSPIAYNTFSYPSYRPISVSKESNFYIVCSGGETYSEDSSPQSAGIRLIKSMNFKQLRLV